MTDNCFSIGRVYNAEGERLAYELECIEKACFSSPWSLDSIKKSLCNTNTDFIIARQNQCGKIIGFCAFSFVIDECEILNIAVYPEHRKKGIAHSLLESAIDNAIKKGVRRFFLEVRESNFAAISLYKSFGFICIGNRKNYYSSPKENAILMSLKLDSLT